MTSGMLAVVTFLSSFLFFVGAVFFSKVRQFLAATGIFIMVAGFAMVFSNWLPQIPDPGPPTPIKIVLAEIEKMPAQELADLGEVVIFGKVGGYEMRAIGKGQCPLCHTFKKGDIGDRAPNLIGIVSRAAKRIKEPRYLHPDTVQLESFPGSGRATTADEYIAESQICPSCYVVAGFGKRGTNDHESPGEPLNLTIPEMITVQTWLYVRDGETPPSPRSLQAAIEKFIPVDKRRYVNDTH